MATTIPVYETERGNEGGDVKHVPEVVDLNAVIAKLNAVHAALQAASVAGFPLDGFPLDPVAAP